MSDKLTCDRSRCRHEAVAHYNGTFGRDKRKVDLWLCERHRDDLLAELWPGLTCEECGGQAERAVLRLALPVPFNKGVYGFHVYVADPAVKRYYDFKRGAARIVVEGPRASARNATGYIHYPHQWEHLR